jgi:hypothetical protein
VPEACGLQWRDDPTGPRWDCYRGEGFRAGATRGNYYQLHVDCVPEYDVTAELSGFKISHAVYADFDNDGDTDVAWAGYDGRDIWNHKVYVLENYRGDCLEPWRHHRAAELGEAVDSMDAKDMDGDGRMDVIVTTHPRTSIGNDGRIFWVRNGNSSSARSANVTDTSKVTDFVYELVPITDPILRFGWSASRRFLSAKPNLLKAVDINQDGYMDIIVSQYTNALFTGKVSAFVGGPCRQSCAGDTSWVLDWHGVFSRFAYEVVDFSLGDVDNDGDDDIAMTVIRRAYGQVETEGKLIWLENIQAALWHSHTVENGILFDGAFLVRVVDLDMDGDSDLVLYTQENNEGLTEHQFT